MIGFAQALKGLIQIYHLANRMLYPNDKWLIANCRKYFPPFYESLMVGHVQLVAQGFSTDAFIGFIRETTKAVVGALELQKLLPDYIIRDLINP